MLKTSRSGSDLKSMAAATKKTNTRQKKITQAIKNTIIIPAYLDAADKDKLFEFYRIRGLGRKEEPREVS